MENIKILQTKDFMEKTIPTDCIPQRFAIATNILLCAKTSGDNKGFLLFNYEPEKWNQWYPYFSSVNDMYSFSGTTYGDIVSIFEKNIMLRIDVQSRIEKAKKSFLELLGIPNGHVSFADSPIVPEMWLKYSKTQNIWTFYYMEFLQVKDLSECNLKSLDSGIVDLMSLDIDTLEEVIKTQKYRGIDVVDNTLDIIKNKDILNKLTINAITI